MRVSWQSSGAHDAWNYGRSQPVRRTTYTAGATVPEVQRTNGPSRRGASAVTRSEPTLRASAVTRERSVGTTLRAALRPLDRLRRPFDPQVAVHALVPILIAALWALTIRDVPLRQMTDLGLVSVLPSTTILLLFALTASF